METKPQNLTVDPLMYAALDKKTIPMVDEEDR
jgi:hypothetical protein